MASEHQVALLAEALGKCLVASGIVRADADLTGPHLLMFAEDLERFLKEATTRPAHAATDTGLVTVAQAYVNEDGECEEIAWIEGLFPHPECIQLVTRSQVEELLAAKDEQLREINELLDAGQGDDDGAQILPDFEDGMSILGKVEACLALLEDRRDVIEGYEAKLAAVEKALMIADEALQADAIASAHAAIRAVLGGEPS